MMQPSAGALRPHPLFSIAHIRGWQGDHYAEVSALADPQTAQEVIHLYVDDPMRPNEPAAVTVDLTVDAARMLANQLITAIAEHLEREEVETNE